MNKRNKVQKNRVWQPEERNYLKTSYATTPMDEIIAKLGRTFSAIASMAFKLEITRCRYSEFNGMRRRIYEPVKKRTKPIIKPSTTKTHKEEKPAPKVYKTRDTITGKVPVRIGPRTVVYLRQGYTTTEVEAVKAKMNIV